MNFGQNLFNWFTSNAQSLVLMRLPLLGSTSASSVNFPSSSVFLVIAIIAVGLVFNTAGVKDVLLNLFNRVMGA